MNGECRDTEERLPKLEFRKSKIHGMGAYAMEDIKRGSNIIEYTGEKISSEEGDRRSQESEEITYVVMLNDRYDIDGGVNGSGAQYLNHSCNPNATYTVIDDHVWLIAIRDIKKGEEVSWDYEMDAEELEACNCGDQKCRGYMNDADDIEQLEKTKSK